MYTLVLMTAMSTAPATPQFDGFFRDLFRGSCNGSCQGSCSGRDAARSGSSCQGSCRGSCQGSCQGGLFNGRIRNFFSDLFDGGSCHGSCNGSCNGRPRDPLPNSRPYDRGLDPAYTRSGCNGGCHGGYAYGGCTGSVPLYMGSCFGSTPNYSCFGTTCMGNTPGLPPMSVPGMPYEYAQPQGVGFGTPGCDCLPGSGGLPFGTPGLPNLGTSLPDYPTIPSPSVPMPPRTMPDGFDNPAQPRPADGRGGSAFKLPMDDETSRGRVQVRLPADAKLFVEGKPLSVTNGERTFVTPPLPTDREAVYTFKVEYSRDGETLAHSRKVRIRAGATTLVDFADLIGSSVKADPVKGLPPVPPVLGGNTQQPPIAPTKTVPNVEVPQLPFDSRTTNKTSAAKTADEVPTVKPLPSLEVAKITVKLPQGATLFVNGGKNERTELVREFTTPTLTPGKVYQYTMRAELTRNGLPEYQESKVEFRAGDSLTVDFTSLAEPPADKRAAK